MSGVGIPVRARHPNAAMLFVDFMLSVVAQKIYSEELGYSSLRKDLQDPKAPAQKVLLALRPDYRRDYEKWGRLADEVFRSGR